MRVLISSTSYPSDENDWRGRFIANMVAALAAQPDINLLSWMPPGNLPINVKNCCTNRERSFLLSLMQQGGIAHLIKHNKTRALFSISYLMLSLWRTYRRENYDIIHANWLQNALTLPADGKPALITVLGSDYALLDKPGMQAGLQRIMRSRSCILAPNAFWMQEKLEHMFGNLCRIQPVLFGVDNRWYNIKRKPTAKPCWIFLARITKPKIGSLFDWGNDFFSINNPLQLIGPTQEKNILLPDWVIEHGAASPDIIEKKWFVQTRALITLSQHNEGLPQVILEAMAAGVPVVASDIKPHRDVIQNGKTGHLVKNKAEFLQVMTMLDDQQYAKEIGSNAQIWVKKQVGDWQDCAKRYLNLYEELLS
ncbi:MAG: glycosyltransferase family 4 protein [Mariprofundales bacterium]